MLFRVRQSTSQEIICYMGEVPLSVSPKVITITLFPVSRMHRSRKQEKEVQVLLPIYHRSYSHIRNLCILPLQLQALQIQRSSYLRRKMFLPRDAVIFPLNLKYWLLPSHFTVLISRDYKLRKEFTMLPKVTGVDRQRRMDGNDKQGGLGTIHLMIRSSTVLQIGASMTYFSEQ